MRARNVKESPGTLTPSILRVLIILQCLVIHYSSLMLWHMQARCSGACGSTAWTAPRYRSGSATFWPGLRRPEATYGCKPWFKSSRCGS